MNDTPTPQPVSARSAVSAGPVLSDWLARVAEAGPIAEQEAPEADRARRLSDRSMAALHDKQMFRMLLPRAFGGHELTLPDYFQVIEKIAAYDASAAWCVCQGNCCAMIAGYLDRDVSENIWGRDPKAILAWGPGKAEAIVVDGGYRVTAHSKFASGSHHATWLGAHGTTVRDADGSIRNGPTGKPENRTVLFPASETELSGDWDVLGLRGTGSDSFEIDDLFVADAYSIVRATMTQNRPPHGAGTLFGFAQMPVHATGFAATAIGTARGFIDAFLDMAQEKTPRLHTAPLRDQAVVQDEVGHAEARLSSSRSWLLSEARAAWEEAEQTDTLSIDQRMRIRLAATHAIHEAKAAVDLLYDAAGTSSVFASSPFERRFRDIHMVAQQVQGRKAHYRTVGAWMLGNDPDLGVV